MLANRFDKNNKLNYWEKIGGKYSELKDQFLIKIKDSS